MGDSDQRYLIAMDDTTYRMTNTAFDRIPQRFDDLALTRVRGPTSSNLVERVGREPVAVVRTSFSVLGFDDAGCVDVDSYRERPFARVENALAPAFADPDRRAISRREGTRQAEVPGQPDPQVHRRVTGSPTVAPVHLVMARLTPQFEVPRSLLHAGVRAAGRACRRLPVNVAAGQALP